MGLDELLVHLALLRLHDEVAPTGHGVPGVRHQVEHDLLHLDRVGAHRPVGAAGLDHQVDVPGNAPVDELLHVLEDRVQAHQLAVHHLLAAEGQERLGEVPGPQAGVGDEPEVLLEVLVLHPLEGGFGGEHHGGEDVVEVVGDSGGQPAHGFVLLGQPELGGQLLPLLLVLFLGADVFQVEGQEGAPVSLEGRGPDVHGDLLAFPGHQHTPPGAVVPARDGQEDVLVHLFAGGLVQLFDGDAVELVGVVAQETLERLVRVHDLPGAGVQEEHGEGATLEEAFEGALPGEGVVRGGASGICQGCGHDLDWSPRNAIGPTRGRRG